MAKGSVFENDFLKLIFNGVPIGGLADNAAAMPLSNFYVSLHTADPGDSGNQSSNEVSYTNYARVAVSRSSAGFTVTGNSVSPVNAINFPNSTSPGGNATYFAIGTDATGPGKLLYSGPVSPILSLTINVQPRLDPASTVTED